MPPTDLDLPALARLAETALDRSRAEILPRFRRVDARLKDDGTPVTEADLAAERVLREVLGVGAPQIEVLGEEYGGELRADRPTWVLDPIDGTISFSRGIPLFGTLISLMVQGESVLGLIDLPALDERYVGWTGGGCRRNGEEVRVSQLADPERALVLGGDRDQFENAGELELFERLTRGLGRFRTCPDAFGQALVLGGHADAMVDPFLQPWDAGPARVLVAEAGGRCEVVEHPEGGMGLVLGSPELVELLLGWR